ncbi:MAG: type IV pilus biogenesis/stability protein PilW [Candidatus Competibacter sp.]|nr:type IV pilus biogenesis/stability protein PilW [Candidatus Competibacteraceae bacterium]
MRPATLATVLILNLLLAACAITKDEEFKENVAETNFKLGIGYMQSGRLDVATEKLIKAIQYNDNYPEAHNALGVLYEELREYGPAETHFKRAMELKSDYMLAKLNYARLICTRDPTRAAEAESQFQKIAEDPANAGATAADANAGLGLCARKRGDPAQAETLLRKALEQNPNNATALYELAQLSQTQGKTLQGRAFLQRYHSQASPSAQSLWLGFTMESAADGDPQLRRDYASVLSSQFPNSEEAQRMRGGQ